MTAANSSRHLSVVEPPDLRGILDDLVNSGRSSNTRRSYRNAWKRFSTFCASRNEDPDRAPAQTVGEFIASLYHDGRSVALMRSAASGLRFRLVQNDRWTPEHSKLVRRALAGAANNRSIDGYIENVQAAPLGWREFGRVMSAGEKAIAGARTDYAKADIQIDVAICSVMRDGLLRRSEASALDWEHIRRDPEDGSAEGTIPRSKTDQQGKGAVFYLSPLSVRLIDAIGRPQRGPVFVSRHGLRADPRTLCRRIQRAIKRAGLTGNFSGHSPRVGMTQDLVQRGFSTTDISIAGRWKGHGMPSHYARQMCVKDGAVARWHRWWESEQEKWRKSNARRAKQHDAAPAVSEQAR